MVEPFREEKLCITVVLELARVITPQNSAVVLPGGSDPSAGGGDGVASRRTLSPG